MSRTSSGDVAGRSALRRLTGTVPAALSAAAVALSVGACGSSSNGGGGGGGAGGGTGPLTFIVFNPFSGPDASFGPLELAGCLPAAAAIQADGGVLGHKSIVCKSVDSRGDPADAVPAAEQALATTSGLVGVIGPSSDEAAATVPLFNRAHIPMSADTGQSLFNTTTDPYFYRVTAPDDAVGYAMALYAHLHGYTRVAAVFGNDIGSQGTAPTAIAGYKKLGGTLFSQTIPLDQTSYRAEVSQLAAFKPQAIMTEADPQTSATYFAELRQLYHLIPIIGNNGTTNPAWFRAMGAAIGTANLDRLYEGLGPYGPTTGESYQQWRQQLAAVAKKVPQPASQWDNSVYTEADWDSVNLFALAALAAKSVNPVVFNPYIVRLTMPSPGAVIVHNFAQGKAALLAGKKIQYVGAIGMISFDRYHNSLGEFSAITPTGKTTAVYTAAQVASAK